jgi:hypothetical protein
VTGDVYIAAMNENGGNSNFTRNNLIYRSTDGGNTWTEYLHRARLPRPAPH